MSEIEILVPVAESRVERHPLADRPGELSGLVIGFEDNQKANAGLLLERVADEMERVIGPFERRVEYKAATMAAPDEVLERLRTCDAVVLAIAD